MDMLPAARPSFQVFVNGNVASALYDSQLAESSISLSFYKIHQIYHRLGVCNTTVAVETSSNRDYFTCAIRFRVLDTPTTPIVLF